MSDTEDPTKKYPSPEDYKTNPMLETILTRINEGLDEMRAGFASVNQRLDKMETEIQELKTELKTGFRKLDRRLNAMDVKLADNATRLDALEDNAA